jgi:hypothetical protein
MAKMRLRYASGIKLNHSDRAKEKLGLLALQQQLQILKMKEILVIISFIFAGAWGRVLMQSLPSIEPLTFFAILAGWLFGSRKGFITGASALYISNFFMFGGQGPWTLFQAIGFGIAGLSGGFLRKNATIIECLMITLISTLIFEIIMNTSSLVFLPSNIFTAFLFALPFTIAHIVSNAAFSALLPKIKSYICYKGSFNEREICMEMFNKLKNISNRKK